MREWIVVIILAGAILGGCLLNAAAINQEWWVEYECEAPESDLLPA
jgi:hypothetical protein